MIKVFMIVRWPVGGIRTFINYVYGKWSEPNIELHFLTPNLPEVDTLKKQLGEKELKCFWYSTQSGDPSFKEFAKTANRICSGGAFDLIHAHGFTSAFSIAWKLPFLKARSIFTSHDVLNKSQFNGFAGTVKKILLPLLLNRFNVIHSVSYDAEQNLRETLPLINKSKMQVILNGIDAQRFYSAEPINLKQKLGIANEVILIGFLGRFMSQKGFKYLVDAIDSLNQSNPNRYQVVCFGSGGFIREEKAALERRQLIHLFHFHDFVADTAPYIKGCNMVLMPSLWEACGLVAMEVLTAGVPLVASSCMGLQEVCENTPAVMVPPANALELAAAVKKVEELDTQEFTRFAPLAQQRFDIADTRTKLQQLYTDLLRS